MRNLGSCFASPILLLLHNGTTKYQTLISIIRQAPRVEMIARLGAPKMVDTDNKGHKQDYFQFQSGLHESSKTRVILYVAADLLTLALAELLLWPLESYMFTSATCVGIATYDSNLKVDEWKMSKKSDSYCVVCACG